MAGMTKKAREKRSEYMRQWRARNPEKVKKNNRLYWERKAGQDDQGDEWHGQERQSEKTSA